MKNPKRLKKPKKPEKRLLDRYTRDRLKKEKACFETDHAISIERYAKEVSRLNEEVGLLEAAIKKSKEEMVDKSLAEEEKKTEFFRGLHEGKREMEETVRKSKACFDGLHRFVEGKNIMNLDLGGVMSLFIHLARDPLFGSKDTRITVLCPMSFSFADGKKTDLDALVKEAVVATFKKKPFIS